MTVQDPTAAPQAPADPQAAELALYGELFGGGAPGPGFTAGELEETASLLGSYEPEPLGFMDALSHAFGGGRWKGKLPFVGVGFDVADMADLHSSLERIEQGTATQEDQSKVRGFLAQATRKKDWTYWMGSVVAEAPTFMAEFMAGGAAMGRLAATKALRKSLESAIKKGGMRGLLARGAQGLAEGTARWGAMEAMQLGTTAAGDLLTDDIEFGSRGVASAYQLMLQKAGVQVGVDEAGELGIVLRGTAGELAEALPLGFVDSWIEVLSESAGGAVEGLASAAAPALRKIPAHEALEAFGLAVAGWWTRTKGRPLAQLIDKAGRAGGWNGIVGELFEERAADAARALVPGHPAEWGDVMPEFEQFLGEVGGFALIGAGRAGLMAGADALAGDVEDLSPQTLEARMAARAQEGTALPAQEPQAAAADSEGTPAVEAQEGPAEDVPRGTPAEAPRGPVEVLPAAREALQRRYPRAREVEPATEGELDAQALASEARVPIVFLEGGLPDWWVAETLPDGTIAMRSGLPEGTGPGQVGSYFWHEGAAHVPETLGLAGDSRFERVVARINAIDPRAIPESTAWYAAELARNTGRQLAPDRAEGEGVGVLAQELAGWLQWSATTAEGQAHMESMAREDPGLLGSIVDWLKGILNRLGGSFSTRAQQLEELATTLASGVQLRGQQVARIVLALQDSFASLDTDQARKARARLRQQMHAARPQGPAKPAATAAAPPAAPAPQMELPRPPSEEGLFGEVERESRLKPRAPESAAPQPKLFDTGEGDLPGQRLFEDLQGPQEGTAPVTKADTSPAKKQAPKGAPGRKSWPSGSLEPTTAVDFLVSAGGIDLRLEVDEQGRPRGMAGDFWERLRRKEQGRRGYPAGLVKGPQSKATTPGLSLEAAGRMLAESGFRDPDGDPNAVGPQAILTWIEDELGGSPKRAEGREDAWIQDEAEAWERAQEDAAAFWEMQDGADLAGPVDTSEFWDNDPPFALARGAGEEGGTPWLFPEAEAAPALRSDLGPVREAGALQGSLLRRLGSMRGDGPRRARLALLASHVVGHWTTLDQEGQGARWKAWRAAMADATAGTPLERDFPGGDAGRAEDALQRAFEEAEAAVGELTSTEAGQYVELAEALGRAFQPPAREGAPAVADLREAWLAAPAFSSFGTTRRVFISDLWDAAGQPGTLDEFKDDLWRRHVAGELELARADLVEAMDSDTVKASQYQRPQGEFHFVKKYPEASRQAMPTEPRGTSAPRERVRAHITPQARRRAQAIFGETDPTYAMELEAVHRAMPGMVPLEKLREATDAEFASIAVDVGPPDPFQLGLIEAGQVSIGGGLFGTAQPLPQWDGKRPVGAPDVMRAMADVLTAAKIKVPLRVGRISQRDAAGIFKTRSHVARIRQAGDIRVAVHELAHGLDWMVLADERNGTLSAKHAHRITLAAQAELRRLGKEMYGETVPKGGYESEGFAEYMAYRVTEGTAADRAPVFHEWFNGWLATQPAIEKALHGAERMASRWRFQGDVKRAAGQWVNTSSPKHRIQNALQTVRGWMTLSAHVDSSSIVQELQQVAEAQVGKGKLGIERSPHTLMASLRLRHSARVRMMVEDGMIDFAGNRVGPALAEIRALVKGRYGDFVTYLYAKRALALWTDPLKPRGRNPGISFPVAERVVAALDSPEFAIAAGKVYEWSEGVLDYAAQASPTYKQIVRRIRAVDPGSYVPLYRIFEALDEHWSAPVSSGKGGGGVLGGSFTQRLKGSGRRIKDPFQSLISAAEHTVASAHKRAVLDAMLRLSNIEGLGHIIEPVPRTQVPAASRSLDTLAEEVRKRLEKAYDESDDETKALVEALRSGIPEEMAGEMVTFWAAAVVPDTGKDPIVAVWDEGKVRWLQVNAELYRTLHEMDVHRLPGLLQATLVPHARFFRAATTGLLPSFALVRNPTTDLMTALHNTRAQGGAMVYFANWMRYAVLGLVRAVSGSRSGMDAYTLAFLRLGGEMAQSLGQDLPHTGRMARAALGVPASPLEQVGRVYDRLRDLLQFPEQVSRVAELRSVAKQVGWDGQSPLTLEQASELALAAAEVTTDFTAAGTVGRTLNQVIPFYNASIQGPRAVLQAMRRNPTRSAAYALSMAALTMAYWYYTHDEEWYEELPDDQRFMYWHFGLPNGERVRIKRPYELGLAWSALPEAMMNTAEEQDPGHLSAWMGQAWDVLTPPVLPPSIRTGVELTANRDFFWDRPIVPQSVIDRVAEEQYRPWTPKVAIAIGKALGVSPLKVEHAVRGLGGGLSADALRSVGSVEELFIGQAMEPADIPAIGTIFARGGQMGTRQRSVDEFYEHLTHARQRMASVERPETPLEGAARRDLEAVLTHVSMLYKARSLVTDPAAKRELTALVLELVKPANEAYVGALDLIERAKALDSGGR